MAEARAAAFLWSQSLAEHRHQDPGSYVLQTADLGLDSERARPLRQGKALQSSIAIAVPGFDAVVAPVFCFKASNVAGFRGIGLMVLLFVSYVPAAAVFSAILALVFSRWIYSRLEDLPDGITESFKFSCR